MMNPFPIAIVQMHLSIVSVIMLPSAATKKCSGALAQIEIDLALIIFYISILGESIRRNTDFLGA